MEDLGCLIMDECLKSAQDCLRIQSVNLKESKVFVRDDIDLLALDRDETSSQSFRSVAKIKEISLTDSKGEDIWDYRFVYSVGSRLVLSEELVESKKDDCSPIVEIIGIFEARYLTKKQLKKEELKAFSVDNVGYHVWPYWREYVQSTCARIGFSPAFEVPMYIISRKEEKSEE